MGGRTFPTMTCDVTQALKHNAPMTARCFNVFSTVMWDPSPKCRFVDRSLHEVKKCAGRRFPRSVTVHTNWLVAAVFDRLNPARRQLEGQALGRRLAVRRR